MRVILCHDDPWSHLVVPNVHLVVPETASEELSGTGKWASSPVFGHSSPNPGAPCFFGTGRCDWPSPPVTGVRPCAGSYLSEGFSSVGETLSLTLTSMPSSDGLGVTSFAAMRTIPKSAATSSPNSAAKRS